MKIKNIYIVAAHLDDVEFGLFGYLQKQCQLPDIILNISIYISSAGLEVKPVELNMIRKKIFFKNINFIRAGVVGSSLCTISPQIRDLKLQEQVSNVRVDIEDFIKYTYMKPEIDCENILIYNTRDIHKDHCTINDICNVIARPITHGGTYDFQEVLTFNIPINDYQQYGIDPNPSINGGSVFIELTKEEIKYKQKSINKYWKAGILKSKIKKNELKIEKLNLVYKRL